MKTKNELSSVEKQVAAGEFKTKNDLMKHIILNILHFESTEERKSDSLDFQEVGILSIKDALDAAYLAGQLSVKK